MNNEVVPGILEKSWDEIEKKINELSQFSKEIHIDFIDGKFVQNVTFLDPQPFSKYSDKIFFEAHLMVENPIQYFSPLAKGGFKRFLGHIEKMPSQEEFVAAGQLLGEVGLALDLDTPIDQIKVPFDDLDIILLMSIHAGFSGQDFEQSVLAKIKELRSKTTIPIEVDGGINDQTLVQSQNAGATRFVSTSHFFSLNSSPG